MSLEITPASTDGPTLGARTQHDAAFVAQMYAIDDRPINILIVDDEPKNLLVLETVLDDPGYRLVRASSADQALLALVVEEFALLILDIRMPGMTGFELAQMIKDRKKTSRVPIIFLTAYYNEDQQVLEGYDTGAVDYLHKPVNPAILRSKVAVFAELYRKNRECDVACRVLLAEVSERRRVEEQLRELNENLEQRIAQRTEVLAEREHFLQRLTDVTPGLLYVFDLEKQCNVFINRSVASVIGYGPEEIAAMGDIVSSTLMHPDDFARLPAYHDRVRASRDDEISDFEFRVRDRAGEWCWFHRRDAVFNRDAAGAVCQLIGTAIEITARKQAEQALRESEQRMRLATEATNVGIWERNVITDEVRWDAVMFQIYGIAPLPNGVVQYQDWSESILPEDLTEQEEVLQDTERRAGNSRRAFRIRRRNDGECRHIEAVEIFRRNETGRTEWVVGTNLDVTDRKIAENQLRQLAADLSDADRRKDEFLALLAHELRNPIAPISNAVQVLRLSEGNKEDTQSVCEMIERQIGQMVRLVDDLLDVSRITRGKIELRRERIDLVSAVNHAVEAVRPNFERIDHELTVTLPPQPVYLNADLTRLSQIVGNLLNNACKFTESGGRISLTVEQEGEQAVIRVRDNGIGIAADQLPCIFDMFVQLDVSLGRSLSGLGIGLMLVKNLVELHGGTVEAHSAGLGTGTEFVVRFPIMAATHQPPPTEPAVSEPTQAPRRRILVVDDNWDSATSLVMLLESSGNEMQTAHDGLEAVEAAGTFRPHVVLLDIGLPKLNGYEAARQIREQPWGKDMVLVALTGWGQEEARQKSRDAGFNGHLTKPVDFPSLEKLIAGFASVPWTVC